MSRTNPISMSLILPSIHGSLLHRFGHSLSSWPLFSKIYIQPSEARQSHNIFLQTDKRAEAGKSFLTTRTTPSFALLALYHSTDEIFRHPRLCRCCPRALDHRHTVRIPFLWPSCGPGCSIDVFPDLTH
jgi:hypothetical protein